MSAVRLRGDGLTRRFGAEQALSGADIAIREGEIVALVGLNGAGKSTLMRLLLGMLRPDAGSAEILGEPVADAPPNVWSQVGHLIESPPRYGELTVAESVYSAGRLQGMSRSRAQQAAAGIISKLELDHWERQLTRTLSLGNRQRLGIAMALVHDPRVLVLDEPANSLDPLGVVRVRELLRERATQAAAILVSSHHLDEVARIADRMVVLHRGRVLGELEAAAGNVEHTFFQRVLEADREQARSR
jgi:ABC-2 type transport system ATP-binding protein